MALESNVWQIAGLEFEDLQMPSWSATLVVSLSGLLSCLFLALHFLGLYQSIIKMGLIMLECVWRVYDG